MKLLLFDIDGTILLTDGAGTRAANRAFEKFFGHRDAMKGVNAAGKTDPLILREMFRNTLSRDYTPDEARGIYEEYVLCLEEEILKSRIDIMPGIPILLEKLSLRHDIALGIATGNIEHGAWIKLKQSRLHVHFKFGGFGSDSENREMVIRKAIERAKLHFSRTDDFDRVFVIGDTPFDIIHGRAAGAVTVAVATGGYPREELTKHNPDYLFDHLEELDAVMKIFE